MADFKEVTVESQLTLPNGVTLSNRLVKAAMAESLAVHGAVDDALINLYTQWGKGGWGAVITGHVMIDNKYTAGPGFKDVEIPSHASSAELQPLKSISSAIKAHGSKAIMQINHPGRQSPIGAGTKGLFEKNIAPSAVSLDFGTDLVSRAAVKFLWGVPAEMTNQQVLELIATFVRAAKVAKESGFDGVEIHAAHGYLLSTFLSPKSNRRSDSWGGSPAKRAAIVVHIIREIRKEVGKGFIVGVKFNSADQTQEGALEAVLEQIAVIAAEELDFLEISGGSYEDPSMMAQKVAPVEKSSSTALREAFFLYFALEARKQFPDLNLMLTGGFRSRAAMNEALELKACDMVGVARPAAVKPDFPRSVVGIGAKVPLAEAETVFHLSKAPTPNLLRYLPTQLGRALAGGAVTTHFTEQIKMISDGKVISA